MYRTSVLNSLRVFWRSYIITLHKVCASRNSAQSSLRSPGLAISRLLSGVLGSEDSYKLCVDFAHAKKMRKPPCDTLLQLINKRI